MAMNNFISGQFQKWMREKAAQLGCSSATENVDFSYNNGLTYTNNLGGLYKLNAYLYAVKVDLLNIEAE